MSMRRRKYWEYWEYDGDYDVRGGKRTKVRDSEIDDIIITGVECHGNVISKIQRGMRKKKRNR